MYPVIPNMFVASLGDFLVWTPLGVAIFGSLSEARNHQRKRQAQGLITSDLYCQVESGLMRCRRRR